MKQALSEQVEEQVMWQVDGADETVSASISKDVQDMIGDSIFLPVQAQMLLSVWENVAFDVLMEIPPK